MRRIVRSNGSAAVIIGIEELFILGNALNAVCNASDAQEPFEVRLGATEQQVRSLLEEVVQILEEMTP